MADIANLFEWATGEGINLSYLAVGWLLAKHEIRIGKLER